MTAIWKYAFAILLVSIFLFMRFDYQWQPVFGQGKYSEQSNALSRLIWNEFSLKGVCTDKFQACPPGLYIEADNSLKINEYIYGVDGNEHVFAQYISLLTDKGIEATQGVPIVIEGYHESRAYYDQREHEHERKPFFKLEITK
ncbi:MAG: hypothetical protein ACRCV6_05030 [Formosimonas sp.]